MYSTNHICGIYKITNEANGKVYIGQSVDVERRIKYHKNDLSKNKHHNQYLQRSYNKYGAENFRFEIIEECKESELSDREIYWIEKLGAFGSGYNLTVGGEGATGHVFTEEQKENMRRSRPDMRGEKNPMYGKKLIDVMGEEAYYAYMERARESRRRTAIENNKNKVITEDMRRRMSEAAKLRNQKYGNPNTGKKRTEAQRAAQSERMKGLYEGDKNPNARTVVLLNTGESFTTIKEAAKVYGCAAASISLCCAGNHKSAGIKDGCRLVWAFKEDCDLMTSEEIEDRISNSQNPKGGAKNVNATKIVCINTGEVFDCIMDACRKYHLDASSVVKCCRGKNRSCGKDPVTGERMHWAYAV